MCQALLLLLVLIALTSPAWDPHLHISSSSSLPTSQKALGAELLCRGGPTSVLTTMGTIPLGLSRVVVITGSLIAPSIVK